MRINQVARACVVSTNVESSVADMSSKSQAPDLFRNAVEFSEGSSTRVVGFKVKAGFVAGIRSASETNNCGAVSCDRWAAFSHCATKTRRATSGRAQRAYCRGWIRANAVTDDDD